MIRTEDGWIRQYQQRGALWIYDGNPRRPHALLSSGMHSNGFFNSQPVILDEWLLSTAASDLLEKFALRDGDDSKIGGVVGLQTGATRLTEELSYRVRYRFGSCFSASPTKAEKDGKKLIIFSDEELTLLPGQSVILCEDVVTTGGNIELTASAVTRARGIVLPWVLALVNRSGLKKVGDKKIVALIDRHMPIWTPNKCPLCEKGSDAIHPKGMDNWARLCLAY